MKTIYGIQQKQEGLRKAAHIIHCSLVTKPINAADLWPLPFDEDPAVLIAARKQEYELLKKQIINGN
jgi:hypothetical protein